MRKQKDGTGTGIRSGGAGAIQPPDSRAPAQGGEILLQPGSGLSADSGGRSPDPLRRPARWEFRDERRTALVIATGPSAGGRVTADWPDWPALCINDAWCTHYGAAALYAADRRWWRQPASKGDPRRYVDSIKRSPFAGELWTCDPDTAREESLWHAPILIREGLGRAPGPIYSGGQIGNSGAQGINLAYRWGARRIVLVGFDMRKLDGKEHWFGDHPDGLGKSSTFSSFISGMGHMAVELHKEGIEVINASPHSALPYWPRTTLERIP